MSADVKLAVYTAIGTALISLGSVGAGAWSVVSAVRESDRLAAERETKEAAASAARDKADAVWKVGMEMRMDAQEKRPVCECGKYLERWPAPVSK